MTKASKLSPAPKKGGAIKASRATICGPANTERSVEIRKISNGFIVRESVCGPKGYKSTETFSPKAPSVQLAPSKGGK